MGKNRGHEKVNRGPERFSDDEENRRNKGNYDKETKP